MHQASIEAVTMTAEGWTDDRLRDFSHAAVGSQDLLTSIKHPVFWFVFGNGGLTRHNLVRLFWNTYIILESYWWGGDALRPQQSAQK